MLFKNSFLLIVGSLTERQTEHVGIIGVDMDDQIKLHTDLRCFSGIDNLDLAYIHEVMPADFCRQALIFSLQQPINIDLKLDHFISVAN